MQEVAVVTGANKGLGLEVVAGLCARFPGAVYLTSRDEARGRAALAALAARAAPAAPAPRYHQLDVLDAESVRRLAEHLRAQHGGLDLLVNNAGVADSVQLYNDYEQSKHIIDTNYRALHHVERHLYPLLRPRARVLHVSSDCGHLSNLRNERWLRRLSRDDLSTRDIDEFVEWHLKAVKSGSFRREDFADKGTVAAYRVSKIAVSALARVQARALRARGVAVNSLHPGLVRTDMTLGVGFLSAHEAARTPLRLALDAPQDQTGTYVWFDGSARDWLDTSLDLYFRTSTLQPTKLS